MLRTLLTLLIAGCAAPTGAEPFTIVALPDTQHYTEDADHLPYLAAQAEWIRDQVEQGREPPIVFVTHLGDVVQRAFRESQYERAAAALAPLDGAVPWSVLPGNHDFAVTGRKFTGTSNYREFFGPWRFEGEPWFGGADPSGTNTFQLFEAGGRTFLHLALEWRPDENVTAGLPRDPSPLEWARAVLRAHPNLPVILSTHEYVDDYPIGRSDSGEEVWEDLVRRNDRIFLVLNGHFHSDGAGANNGEYMQISRNAAGRVVVEMLQDYQDQPNGGNGWLRLITFDPEARELRARTYSPALDEHQNETLTEVGHHASRFAIPIDLEARWSPPPRKARPGAVIRTVLRRGVIREIRSSGERPPSDWRSVAIDAQATDSAIAAWTQALIRFREIEGSRPRPDAVLHEARLILHTTDEGDGAGLHRVLRPWRPDVRWRDFGGDGVQTDGLEAAIVPDATVDEGEDVVALDVTRSVRRWLEGAAPNHGWALLPRGHDGWDIATFTAPEELRPRLELIWRPRSR